MVVQGEGRGEEGRGGGGGGLGTPEVERVHKYKDTT